MRKAPRGRGHCRSQWCSLGASLKRSLRSLAIVARIGSAPVMASRLAAAIIVSTSACRQDVTVVDSPPPPPDTTSTGAGGGGGSVQRARLSLTLLVDYQDETVGAALGWTDGAVPGADVSVERTEAPVERRSGVTDAAGGVVFDSLLTGDYQVSVLRGLDAAERARLPAGAQDVDALGGGTAVGLAAGGSSHRIGVLVGRRGSLVISEYWFPLDLTPEASGVYPYAGYLELYNQSDTTIYLDGKFIGHTAVQYQDYPNFPCTRYEAWSDDSLGVWAQYVYQFPGTGRYYPLLPGKATIVATDAIDHRVVNPSAEDLSSAEFEFAGGPDNPLAADLVNVGTREHYFGDGVIFWGMGVPFVANRVDVGSLPRAYIPDYSLPHVRIPAEAVLDVAIFLPSATRYPVCPTIVHPRFARLPGAVLPPGDFAPASMQRRVFRQEGDKKILLRTLNSGRDFVVAFPRTPGRP